MAIATFLLQAKKVEPLGTWIIGGLLVGGAVVTGLIIFLSIRNDNRKEG